MIMMMQSSRLNIIFILTKADIENVNLNLNFLYLLLDDEEVVLLCLGLISGIFSNVAFQSLLCSFN